MEQWKYHGSHGVSTIGDIESPWGHYNGPCHRIMEPIKTGLSNHPTVKNVEIRLWLIANLPNDLFS